MELKEVFGAQTKQMTKSEVVEMLQFLVGEYHKLERELDETNKELQHKSHSLKSAEHKLRKQSIFISSEAVEGLVNDKNILQKLQGILKPFVEEIAEAAAEQAVEQHEDYYQHEHIDY